MDAVHPEIGAILAFTAIGLSLTVPNGIAIWRGWRATEWRETMGRIVADELSIDTYGEDRDLTRGPTVRYYYEVEGVGYDGHRISFARSVPVLSRWNRPLWGESADVRAGLREGTEVKVWYHPAHPDRAVLRPGVDPGFILLYMAGVGALVIAALLVASALGA